MELFNTIHKDLQKDIGSVVFTHTDIVYGLGKIFSNKERLLQSQLELIKELIGSASLWMPVFNWDFVKSGCFDLNNSPSQVGVLNEYFRLNFADWRTIVPNTSVCGEGMEPKVHSSELVINQWGAQSVFQKLLDRDATILQYGSKVYTICHFVENLIPVPYRYLKDFKGYVVGKNSERKHIHMRHYTRPLGYTIQYDTPKIENHLRKEGLLNYYKKGRSEIRFFKVRHYVDFIISKLREDVFYLLDKETQAWVIPMLEKIGRPFDISDFENIERS